MEAGVLLAGDIGGTKTNLALFSHDRGPYSPLAKETFPSGAYPSLEALAHEFLGSVNIQIDRAAFGVAGPVVEGRAKITNLPWEMEEDRLSNALNVSSVSLLNDLEAIAHAVPSLTGDDIHTLNSGRSVDHGAIGVIAPGTGLGEAFLAWDGTRYRVHASEGGHTDFAPIDDVQVELLRFLLARGEHVSYERVCSGRGLPNVYTFLRETGRYPEPTWLKERLAAALDPSPIITQAALSAEPGNEISRATLELFVAILGAEAGNLALKLMANGGIYIGGGIPPRILQILEDGHFMRAFLAKGRLANLLREIPVHIILNPEVALFGAACHGLEVDPD
jgi:glucokinase